MAAAAQLHKQQQQQQPKCRSRNGSKTAAAHLLGKVQAGVVSHKGPADDGAQEGKGPGDPELVAVAQVVEPDHHQYGAHLACGCRYAVGCASNRSRVHLHTRTCLCTHVAADICPELCF